MKLPYSPINLRQSHDNLYDFKMNSLDGELIDFSIYKGKTLLIS